MNRKLKFNRMNGVEGEFKNRTIREARRDAASKVFSTCLPPADENMEMMKLYAAFVDLKSELARRTANVSDRFGAKPQLL